MGRNIHDNNKYGEPIKIKLELVKNFLFYKFPLKKIKK